MNRQQRRQLEKQSKKDKKYTLSDLHETSEKRSQETLEYTVEKLMSCFALTLHEEFGFGQKRLIRALQSIDDYMGQINDDSLTMEEILQRLENETGVIIKCQ